MSLGRSHFQLEKLQAVSNLFQNTCPRFSGMAPYRKISSHCCSDRLTVTVVATVAVTAAVTVIVTAAVAVTSMENSHEHTDIQREKMIGAAATSPPTAGGGTCLKIIQ